MTTLCVHVSVIKYSYITHTCIMYMHVHVKHCVLHVHCKMAEMFSSNLYTCTTCFFILVHMRLFYFLVCWNLHKMLSRNNHNWTLKMPGAQFASIQSAELVSASIGLPHNHMLVQVGL